MLDNFEQLAPAALHVAKLLANTSNLKILITSRAPLRISAEQVLALPPLEQAAARQLFIERARAANATVRLALGESAWSAAFEAGHAGSQEQAIAEAIADGDRDDLHASAQWR